MFCQDVSQFPVSPARFLCFLRKNSTQIAKISIKNRFSFARYLFYQPSKEQPENSLKTA